MDRVKRIKKLILSPGKEWVVIANEQDSPLTIFYRYVLPMVFIGALAIFIGYGWIGLDSFLLRIKGWKWGLWFGLRYFISGISVYFIAGYVISMLAGSFMSEKNAGKSAQLVAYSSTPSWISAIFMVIPKLGFISVLGLYGVYLFYIGLPILKKTPDDKRVIYMLVSALIIIILTWVLQVIIGFVLNPLLGDPYASTAEDFRILHND